MWSLSVLKGINMDKYGYKGINMDIGYKYGYKGINMDIRV